MKNLVYLLVVSIGLTSCNSSPDDENLINNTDVIGKWNWYLTSGGFGNSFNETPESTGTEIQLRLNSNYSLEIFENGIEVSNGTYELSFREEPMFSAEQERNITFYTGYQNQNIVLSGIIRAGSNTLKIDEPAYDGYGSSFVRIE